jgi:hypothetical protein
MNIIIHIRSKYIIFCDVTAYWHGQFKAACADKPISRKSRTPRISVYWVAGADKPIIRESRDCTEIGLASRQTEKSEYYDLYVIPMILNLRVPSTCHAGAKARPKHMAHPKTWRGLRLLYGPASIFLLVDPLGPSGLE